jgi:hypothetical protein
MGIGKFLPGSLEFSLDSTSAIDKAALKPGKLVTFRNKPGVYEVGRKVTWCDCCPHEAWTARHVNQGYRDYTGANLTYMDVAVRDRKVV